ncbi:MAG TPA: hypothetical protein VE604_13585 [Candidatus Polarisedimenticolia bacterium]|nr:hypothetical protein [Candidatus Polarisedimenticolia bacterium]
MKAQQTRSVLRIFISSTAVDLIDYREKVRDAVLRLEGLPPEGSERKPYH